MEHSTKKVIATKMGEMDIDQEKVIHFPRGLIGFEKVRDFVLLQIRQEAPFLLLQSLDDPSLGLILADPFLFMQEYAVKVGTAEEKLLGVQKQDELVVLVTVTIPEGKPERTTLNLTGPIVINSRQRVGMQIPQVDPNTPAHFVIGNVEDS